MVRELAVGHGREESVPRPAFEAPAAEGLRMTTQHLRDLAQPRRSARLVATVIRLEAGLTDAALTMFEKLMGVMLRRAEREATGRAAGTPQHAQTHLRLLARAGRATIAAHEAEADPIAAVEEQVGWSKFLRAVVEAEGLARPETLDPRGELVQHWQAARQFAPALLEAFAFEGASSAAPLLKAVALLREMNRTGKRLLPADAPTGFIRRAWRPLVLEDGKPERRAWEMCVLSELRDRLRAGEVWVRGSRRYRSFDACLISPGAFGAMRASGAPPIAASVETAEHIDTGRDRLAAAMKEVAALADAGRLPDATLTEGELKIWPLRSEDPLEARQLAERAHELLPRIKITDLLPEVDSWTGFTACFTHRRSGRPTDDRASLLTAILADGINLGLTANGGSLPRRDAAATRLGP